MGKNQYVSPRGNKWVAQGEGNKRATRVVATQKEAIEMAQKDDVILIAGKGHENYQIIGKVKHHFDDKEIAQEFLNNK